MTVDIEKSFDSINHFYLLRVPKKFEFRSEFIKLIKMLIKNLEWCAINDGTTTPCFRLERRTRQGDPISAYLFILA